jgi:hypothetical protein
VDAVEVVEVPDAESEPQEEPVAAAPAPRRAAPAQEDPPPVPAGPARPRPAIPRVDTVELTREFGGLFDGPGSR